MKLTLVHPCVGKIPGEKYIRGWQMEPLPMAQIAALTPKDVEITFFDDRMEAIPFEEPADLVALSVETYTARRAYQIASEYRKRNIPVVMGGFHATLCPEEVAEHADAVVTGEAEGVWAGLIDDFRQGRLKKYYRSNSSICDYDVIPDRSIYKGKNYLNVTLIEFGRGCRFKCEFCSIQKFFDRKHASRKIETVVKEVQQLKRHTKLFFIVDDNITANHKQAKELFKALIPLKIKWVGQADINVSRDKELLELMAQSGCQGILVGLESLNPDKLKFMNKGFNHVKTGPESAIRLFHKYGIRLYVTFLFGYGDDSEDYFRKVLKFCIKNKIFMVGFNHLTPFPGTELYERLEKENLLIHKKWWLSEDYRYGQIPFITEMPHEEIEKGSVKIRKSFYSLASIMYRMTNPTNIKGFYMFWGYFIINLMLRKDTSQRMRFPLGDPEF